MKEFFSKFKEQFSELDMLERIVFIFCCVGLFFLCFVGSYLFFDFF